jgi:hypothetical protein
MIWELSSVFYTKPASMAKKHHHDNQHSRGCGRSFSMEKAIVTGETVCNMPNIKNVAVNIR